MGNIKFYKF